MRRTKDATKRPPSCGPFKDEQERATWYANMEAREAKERARERRKRG